VSRPGQPPFWTELARAVEGVPGAMLERCSGFARVTVALDAIPHGLSERTAALLAAFPESAGRRTVRVDVRNRHWAAMVLELMEALAADERARG
jgi:hypothetical protein